MALSAAAEGPRPLSDSDARRYAAAFEASDRGDFIDAQMKTSELRDKSLLGYLSFRQLMHPSAHVASFEELSGWLAKFRDLPLAERIFSLAARRKPAEAAPPPAPTVRLAVASTPKAPVRPISKTGRAAREAFYSGDARRALKLAQIAGERWIAGLSAYRLGDFAGARTSFVQVAQDDTEDRWLRSGAAYWAARSAIALGDPMGATASLRQAAAYSETFYGMIADRQVRMQTAQAAPAVRPAAWSGSSPGIVRLVAGDARAHRAAALAQLGRTEDARREAAAGLSQARTAAERESWTAMLESLGGALLAPFGEADYPTPALEPRAGFTIDKALVYAIVRQESRFDPLAVSSAGAIGLMQLMPGTAVIAAGDDKLKTDTTPLFDPAFNLQVGQNYVSWLMERGVGYDILRTVAAYNGGPGTLLKTAQMLGEEADSLLIIECLPAQETRNYVEKVMAGYWAYKRQWGEDARTLDAIASGARFVDARLDLPETGKGPTQALAQRLQFGMR